MLRGVGATTYTRRPPQYPLRNAPGAVIEKPRGKFPCQKRRRSFCLINTRKNAALQTVKDTLAMNGSGEKRKCQMLEQDSDSGTLTPPPPPRHPLWSTQATVLHASHAGAMVVGAQQPRPRHVKERVGGCGGGGKGMENASLLVPPSQP